MVYHTIIRLSHTTYCDQSSCSPYIRVTHSQESKVRHLHNIIISCRKKQNALNHGYFINSRNMDDVILHCLYTSVISIRIINMVMGYLDKHIHYYNMLYVVNIRT